MGMGNLLEEKGTYQILIGAFIRSEKWHLREREGGSYYEGKSTFIRKENFLAIWAEYYIY